MDRARETPPSEPVVRPARPRFGRRRPDAPLMREIEPVALGPQPKRAWARLLRNIVLVAAAGAAILALKLTVPALARSLPGCASPQVRDVLLATARREIGAQNIAFRSLAIAGAREVPTRDGRLSCRARLHVDANSVELEYEIGWSNWLLGRFIVDARPAPR